MASSFAPAIGESWACSPSGWGVAGEFDPRPPIRSGPYQRMRTLTLIGVLLWARHIGMAFGLVAFAHGVVAVSLGGVWAVTCLVALGTVMVGAILWGRRLTHPQITRPGRVRSDRGWNERSDGMAAGVGAAKDARRDEVCGHGWRLDTCSVAPCPTSLCCPTCSTSRSP
jgi:hypothetical protein